MWKALLCLSALLVLTNAATKDQWRSRTIYQLLTDRFSRGNGDNSPCANLGNYCGGTFKGITQNLDYIQNMGFDAIWISPIPVNYEGAYHGYAAIDLYGVNPYFGTEQDLLALVSACHSRGIYVMLDVVANHVGPVTPNWSQINPFNKAEYYHPYCEISNWNNQTNVEWCWLGTLPDLAQENPFVRQTLKSWIHWIVNKYGFDGLRVDTAVEVPMDFWAEFSMSSGVYTVGETFNGDINYVASYQGPLDGILNYPLFFLMRNMFQQGGDMFQAREFMDNSQVFPDQSILGSFVDNHDNPRFLNGTSNLNSFKNALAWSMTTMGIPIIYYGDEQGFSGGPDPGCREVLWPYLNQTTSAMYTFVSQIVKYRKTMQLWNYPWIERYADHQFYCFSRGMAVMAFSNTVNTMQRSVTYNPYNNGQVVCNIFWQGDCVTVTNGALNVVLLNGEVKLYMPQSMMVDQ